ncbi:hypothetical protein MHK_006920 [Candidatus Magnetomorum sp. HK-1]|nr:hypothetical protein MHK_006920 [Candidatus Magnetomorum sp. HK-1]
MSIPVCLSIKSFTETFSNSGNSDESPKSSRHLAKSFLLFLVDKKP